MGEKAINAQTLRSGLEQNSKIKNKTKPKSAGKFDFETLYSQISGENTILEANKFFWTRKGNSQKYTCTLCNIGVKVSTNLSIFKSAVLAHVEDKYHKKRYETFAAQETVIDCPRYSKEIDTKYEERSILDILKEYEEDLVDGMQEFDKDNENGTNNSLVDFSLIYNSFEKSNPVVRTSKQFIVKTENGRHFYCTLCKVLILNCLNAVEFRYNLWIHLNDEGHRERLPNFSEVEEDFEKLMTDLFKALPAFYEYDLKHFEVGPVFRFVKCSLCDVAVSANLHRLENHLKEKEHIEKKHSVMKKELLQADPVSHRTRNAFRKLVVQLDDQFKKDVKYIQIGKIPGYVVCSLCTYVVLPTKFYIETHLESAVHTKNKTTNLVNRNSKFKITLKDLMQTLPEDLKGYKIFEETACGLMCKRCHIIVSPTSFDIYSHINKERLACVSV